MGIMSVCGVQSSIGSRTRLMDMPTLQFDRNDDLKKKVVPGNMIRYEAI